MEYEVGMLVVTLPRHPDWEQEGPSYVDGMLKYAGKTLTVCDIGQLGWVGLSNGYQYDPRWIIPADNVE